MASENSKIVSLLNNVIDSSIDKYSYFLARYFNDAGMDLRRTWDYNYFSNYAFDFKQDADLLRSAYTNVIKSVIDTLTSKIATQKVRPFFTPVNGTYKTRQVIRDIQTYFDLVYDEADVHSLMSEAFRDACIFGKGYIYINPITYKISVAKPHTLAFLDSEMKYGNPRKMLFKYLGFPCSLLKDYGIPERKDETCTLWHYIDLDKKQQELFVNGRSVKTLPYKATILPIVELYYNKPVFGYQTTSIVQELDGIQTQIDLINSKISACAQLTPANTTYVIEGSNLSVADIDNRVGKVYGIRMPPGTNTPPVVNVAPPIFDNQWLTLLEYYVKQAFEITGVSQLSAMSKKPSGLDSGLALKTLEDVESDRLEIAMNHYIQSYVDLAKVIMEILPENEDILPESLNTSSLKWKDIKEQRDLFKVQFSALPEVSKDPATAAEQLQAWVQIGLITQDQIAEFTGMPDLKRATSLASAVNNGVEQCIQRAIEYEDYEIPDFINYQNLAQAIAKEENILYASLKDDEDKNEDIEESLIRLLKLEDNLLTLMEENGFVDLSNDMEEQVTTDNGLSSGQGTTQVNDITTQLTNGTNENLTETQSIGAGSEAKENDNLANPPQM